MPPGLSGRQGWTAWLWPSGLPTDAIRGNHTLILNVWRRLWRPAAIRPWCFTADAVRAKAVRNGIQKVNLATELVVAGKEALEEFFKDPNFDKWKLIPAFIKGYEDRLTHYVKLFGQDNQAWAE